MYFKFRAGSLALFILLYSSILCLPVNPNSSSLQPTPHDYTPPTHHLEPRYILHTPSNDQPEFIHLVRRHHHHSFFHRLKSKFAKVAKFGLELVSAATAVVAKASNIIPGAGKGISSVLKGVSAGTNAASNAIHAHLSSALQKGMKVLNFIRNPIAGAKGKALNTILKREKGAWVL